MVPGSLAGGHASVVRSVAPTAAQFLRKSRSAKEIGCKHGKHYIHCTRVYCMYIMCVYIYIIICTIYIYIYMHNIYIHIHTHIHTYIHACMHACMHAYIHIYIYVCMYVIHRRSLSNFCHPIYQFSEIVHAFSVSDGTFPNLLISFHEPWVFEIAHV